jgi:hypothetical protein
LSREDVWWLWGQMASKYGHRWTSQYGAEPWNDRGAGAGNVWQHDLGGLTRQDLERGIERCMERDDAWPPTLPEFRRLCLPRPEDFGVPDEEEAFMEAAGRAHPCAPQHDWSHPTVVAAFRRMGRHRFHELERREARRAWHTVWRRVVRQYMAGRLDEAEIALPAPKDSSAPPEPASPETANREMDRIFDLLGGKREEAQA